MASHLIQTNTGDGRTLARRARYDLAYRAAIELFIERGYEQTTMEAIAERAGTSRASVFNYFPRKPSILSEWSRRRRAAVSELLVAEERAEKPGLRVALERYMDAWATVNEQNRAETVACGPASLRETDLLTNSGMSHELKALFDDAARRGELAPDADTSLAATGLAAAYFAVLGLWIASEQDDHPTVRDDLRRLADLFLDGLLDGSA